MYSKLIKKLGEKTQMFHYEQLSPNESMSFVASSIVKCLRKNSIVNTVHKDDYSNGSSGRVREGRET